MILSQFSSVRGAAMERFLKRRHRCVSDYSPSGGKYGPAARNVRARHAIPSPDAPSGASKARSSSSVKHGRGSHNPQATLKSRQELWGGGQPVPCLLSEALPTQRAALQRIEDSTRDSLPEWAVVTEHGLFCSTCMAAARLVADG